MAYAQRLIATRRGATLIAALAALLAGVLVLVYVARYRSSVKAEGAPVTVLIARQAIPKGTSGAVIASTGLYTATTIRQSQLLNGAYSDASSLRDKVATRDIYPGAQLATSDFAAAASNIAASLSAHERIVSIPFDASHGLLADLQAGDRVDIYAVFNVIPINRDGTPSGGGQSRPVLRMIMGNISVVGVGGKATSGSANIQFRLSDVQATKLAFASDNGKLWLALRPSAKAKSAPPSIVSVETLMLGVPPVTVLDNIGARR
jgi:Flp pilus assembly protein CpaB